MSDRLAKDPLTDENYHTGKDMTFKEWKESFTPEQKQAFEVNVRKYRNKASDKKQYERYIKRLGAENLPETFDKFQMLKYTNIEKWELLKDYYKSRGTNIISAFTSFDDYQTYKRRINDEFIGLTTVDGIKIKEQSKHFIERVFGTNKDPKSGKSRNGVELEDIKEALLDGEPKHRNDCLRYFGKCCVVSVNINNGTLIQTNPR